METTTQYVNRVGTNNAKTHYESEIRAKMATVEQIRSLYAANEALEQEDVERIAHIESMMDGYERVINEINAMPFVKEPAAIRPVA